MRTFVILQVKSERKHAHWEQDRTLELHCGPGNTGTLGTLLKRHCEGVGRWCERDYDS